MLTVVVVAVEARRTRRLHLDGAGNRGGTAELVPRASSPTRGHHSGPAAVVPQQLPSALALFTGRHRELVRLNHLLDSQADPPHSVTIAVISGTAGIGKSALALHWAHQHIDSFPDGQLYVDLRGFDPSGSPMPTPTAIHAFLNALGADPQAVPAELDAQAAMYRTLLANKRLLIVLDNARDASQVEPLLPGSSSCTVLITSRNHLARLHARGALSIDLKVFTDDDAGHLLARHIGSGRIATEPDAASALLRRCAGSPLAISVVAARAAARPGFPLAVFAEELRDESARLDALDSGDLVVNVRAALSWSYQALEDASAKAFRLLGVAPGPDISLPAAGSLIAQSAPKTRTLLGTLEAVNLVHQHVPGRYRMHDLVRLYAAERARHTRDAPLQRLVDFYIHTAAEGVRLLDPYPQEIEIGEPEKGCIPLTLNDAAEALSWFEAEYDCLQSIQKSAQTRGWHLAVWRLAWALTTYQRQQGRLRDYITMWEAGLAAAIHLGDRRAQAWAHRQLGQALSRAERHADAHVHLQQAVALAETVGDLHCEAAARRSIARAWARQGDDQRALVHATHALRLYRALDAPVSEARGLNTVGWYYARLGRYEEARIHCEAALASHRQYHYREGEALTLDSLGYIAQRAGRFAEAINHHRRAVALFRDIGNPYKAADTLDHVGEALAALGQYPEARDAWRDALDLYQTQHRLTQARHVQDQIARLGNASRGSPASGRYRGAVSTDSADPAS